MYCLLGWTALSFSHFSKLVFQTSDPLNWKGRGYQEFSHHHLPYPDKTVNEAKEFYKRDMRIHFNEVRIIQYSADQAKLYINSFFKQLESAYKAFVDDNFPTLKNQFKILQVVVFKIILTLII